MPNDEKSREVNLDNRHLVACFIGVVIICGGFFVLGYFVGLGESRSRFNALSISDKQNSELKAVQGKLDPTSENFQGKENDLSNPENTRKGKTYKNKLGFYSAVRKSAARADFNPVKPSKKLSKRNNRDSQKSQRKVETSKKVLSLQVSAVTNRTQAERLAQKLRSKGYPVFVLAPSKRTNPAWIKVQVGPFKTMKKVSEIKIKLKKDGYSSFLQSK